jgi:ferredoxin
MLQQNLIDIQDRFPYSQTMQSNFLSIIQLEMDEKRVRIRNRDACMECGACNRNCPAGVGCAAAVINEMLNRQNGACFCTIDPQEPLACKAGETRCS